MRLFDISSYKLLMERVLARPRFMHCMFKYFEYYGIFLFWTKKSPKEHQHTSSILHLLHLFSTFGFALCPNALSCIYEYPPPPPPPAV
jgi:hypothetical protein